MGFSIRCVIEVPAGLSPNAHSVGVQWRGFGQRIGMLQSIGIPFRMVRPAAWKKQLGIGADTEQAIALAREYLPNLRLLRTPRCSKPSDGRADLRREVTEFGPFYDDVRNAVVARHRIHAVPRLGRQAPSPRHAPSISGDVRRVRGR